MEVQLTSLAVTANHGIDPCYGKREQAGQDKHGNYHFFGSSEKEKNP
jgi:hypothetical protein